MDGAEKGDLSKIGSIKASVASKTQSMWKKVKSWFVSSPRRVFLKAHQFFGCSHLMAVRYFVYLIRPRLTRANKGDVNTCTFGASHCPDLAHFHNVSCPVSPGPRMDHYADLLRMCTRSRGRNSMCIRARRSPIAWIR